MLGSRVARVVRAGAARETLAGQEGQLALETRVTVGGNRAAGEGLVGKGAFVADIVAAMG